jgi:hypothetical protein
VVAPEGEEVEDVFRIADLKSILCINFS